MTISTPYTILQLKPKRERSILLRHPWIFSGAITAKPQAQTGDIVEVRAEDARVLGYGFYDNESQIVCRMFSWEDDGSFEEDIYWMHKVDNALALRRSVIDFSTTNCYRLMHSEGDFLPGIIMDVYGDVVVLQVLIKGIELRIDTILRALENQGFLNIYIKAKSSAERFEKVALKSGFIRGGVEGAVEVMEHGHRFLIDFVNGQKTGFFLDQRENRLLLGTYTRGKKVLNTFSYTGGFSVYAAMAGAEEIISVDTSKDAIAACEENVRLNAPDANHQAIVADCFDYLKEMPDNYFDIIILDPPAFAKHSGAVDQATRGYKQINLRAIQKIRPGGLLFTFSCSQNIDKLLFQKILFGAAADARRNVRIIHQLHQPADHPVNIYHPESEYLKGFVLYVE